MNRSTRLPFTKPLTSTERRIVICRINEVLRVKGRHVRKNNGTHDLDFDTEVEDAIRAFREMSAKQLVNLNEEVAA